MVAAEATADVKKRGWLVVETPGITAAEPAGRDKRADERQPDLSAVSVPGEHEVEVVGLGPRKLVWGMREEQAKVG